MGGHCRRMKKILVALDSSERSAMVLDAALRLAHVNGARIHLYRAVAIPAGMPTTFFNNEVGKLSAMLLDQAKADMDGFEKKVPSDLFAGSEVQLATAWDGICNAAKQHDVDLIVIGSHGYETLDRLLGTTAGRVVNHAACSVLVVRPDRHPAL